MPPTLKPAKWAGMPREEQVLGQLPLQGSGAVPDPWDNTGACLVMGDVNGWACLQGKAWPSCPWSLTELT